MRQMVEFLNCVKGRILLFCGTLNIFGSALDSKELVLHFSAGVFMSQTNKEVKT